MTAVDQTLTRADEKEKLILTNARIEQYDAIEAPLIDSESSKVSPVPLIVLYIFVNAATSFLEFYIVISVLCLLQNHRFNNNYCLVYVNNGLKNLCNNLERVVAVPENCWLFCFFFAFSVIVFEGF